MTNLLATLFAVLQCVLAPATGPTSAPATLAMDHKPFGGMSIAYPRGWSARELAQLGGLLIVCPTTESDWQANAFVELRTETTHALTDSLERMEKDLKQRKRDFKLLDKRIASHAHGYDFGVIDYSCRDVTGLALIEHEVVIPLPNEKQLCILFSTADAMRDKYEPIFEQMIDALMIKRT